jgi:prepilin-type N-terminal cleavage/methylation domain-containing protein
MTRRRGFTLTEMLLAVLLTGLFGIISMRLMRANFQVAHTTFTADNNAARFDGAVASLRADLADSISCEMPNATTLRIYQAKDRIVDWHADSTNLTRNVGNDVHIWTVGKPIGLKIDGAIVLLSSSDDSLNAIAIATPAKGKK